MHHDLARALRRLLDPELLEAREFLASRFGGLYGKAAGGQPVAMMLADRPEIARSEKRHYLLKILLARKLAEDAEPGEPRFRRAA